MNKTSSLASLQAKVSKAKLFVRIQYCTAAIIAIALITIDAMIYFKLWI